MKRLVTIVTKMQIVYLIQKILRHTGANVTKVNFWETYHKLSLNGFLQFECFYTLFSNSNFLGLVGWGLRGQCSDIDECEGSVFIEKILMDCFFMLTGTKCVFFKTVNKREFTIALQIRFVIILIGLTEMKNFNASEKNLETVWATRIVDGRKSLTLKIISLRFFDKLKEINFLSITIKGRMSLWWMFL